MHNGTSTLVWFSTITVIITYAFMRGPLHAPNNDNNGLMLITN